MKDRELTIDRILDINAGVNMALAIDDLPNGKTTFDLSLFHANLKPHVEAFNKAKEVEQKRIAKKQAELVDKKPEGWRILVANLNQEFTQFIEKLKADINKGKKGVLVKCPEFKFEDFCAQEDGIRPISGKDGAEIVKIKKGQALLPGQFFVLMGDLIKQ